nr:MAG TPA: protein of unknown function (DUF5320) [Ackermannviridae sp.]
MKHILHKRSNVTEVNSENVTLPKLPEAEALKHGEIAINYADGFETIAIKNSNDKIVTFTTTDNIIEYLDNQLGAESELEKRIKKIEDQLANIDKALAKIVGEQH